MKKAFYILFAVLLAAVSCQREQISGVRGADFLPEGALVQAVISVQFPEPVPAASTRAAMSEGPEDLELYLALFGEGGFLQNWIPATLYDLTKDANGYITGGRYKVMLPIVAQKRVVHFVGNPPQNENPPRFDYENLVMEQLVSKADKEGSYWQMVTLENGILAQKNPDGTYVVDTDGNYVADEESVAPLNGVCLLRNFAKITVTSPDESSEDYEGFTVKRWTLINVPTQGYVAPYLGESANPRYPVPYTGISTRLNGTDLYDDLAGRNYPGVMPPETRIDESFPGDPDNAEYSALYVGRGQALYMYERPLPNSEQAQTSILVEIEFDPGHALNISDTDPVSYWYKIEVLNNVGAYFPFYRNIVYQMCIKGIEEAGEATAQAAYEGAFFGNISASLETSSLNDLSNGTSTIHVDAMDYTSQETGEEISFGYYFIPDESNPVKYYDSAADICTITIDLLTDSEGGVEYDPAVSSISVDRTNGTITVTMGEVGTSIKKSIVRVKGKVGNEDEAGKVLYREVVFNLMPKQDFTDETRILTTMPITDAVDQEVKINIHLPEGLGPSVFPLQIRFEAEQNSLSATTPDLPVVMGESSFDSKEGKNTYAFVRTISFAQYKTLNKKTKKYEYHLDHECVFYTSKKSGNSTDIFVSDLGGYFTPKTLTLTAVTPAP